jgi:hypothetical protein
MKVRHLFTLCAAVLLLSSCEEERVQGDVVGPLVGPRVAESLLALNIVDGVPQGITDIFELGDFVNLWVHWEALEPPHAVDVVWYDPFGSSYETGVDLELRASQQVTVFTLELTSQSATGRWEVELYLDGEFVRSHTFLVVEDIPAG